MVLVVEKKPPRVRGGLFFYKVFKVLRVFKVLFTFQRAG